MANHKQREPENAILTLISTQAVDGETDSSELNTTASYRYSPECTEIAYTELDENGNEAGKTVISILDGFLVSIHKTGFAEALMILECGKTHPVKYETIVGTMEMMLCAIEVNGTFDAAGGTMRLRYLIDIGENYSAMNTIDLRVSLR